MPLVISGVFSRRTVVTPEHTLPAYATTHLHIYDFEL